VHLIGQTEDTEHSPWICHGIVIVLYNVSAASSAVIREEWLRVLRREVTPVGSYVWCSDSRAG
jgi:hypothetical protein